MNLRSSPFPGKTQPLDPKGTRKSKTYLPKTTTREPTISRQKRVFGAAKNTNIPTKQLPNNPLNKASIRVPQKQPNPSKPTPLAKNIATIAKTDETSLKKEQPKVTKRGFCVPKQENTLQEENVTIVVSPRTPVVSPSLNKSDKNEGTPYRTAEKCSKCRFDRLEIASYWLGQIKLAESVGKHFVSVAFFRLAFESRAEPIRNLRIELKRYLGRHRFLSTQSEWRDVSVIYKLQKEENKGRISGIDEARKSNINLACCDLDEGQNIEPDQSFQPLKPICSK